MLERSNLGNLTVAWQTGSFWLLERGQLGNLTDDCLTGNFLLWNRGQVGNLTVDCLTVNLWLLEMSKLGNLTPCVVLLLSESGDPRCWLNVNLNTSHGLGKLELLRNLVRLTRGLWEIAESGRRLSKDLLVRRTR